VLSSWAACICTGLAVNYDEQRLLYAILLFGTQMMNVRLTYWAIFLVGNLVAGFACAEDQAAIEALLKQPIIGADVPQAEVEAFCEKRVPTVPRVDSKEEWGKLAEQWRQQMLKQVVLRGEGVKWRAAERKIEWQEAIEGGPGYRITKLRYEAIPGMWIPALLYEPEKLSGKVPVVLNVNGHDQSDGKAAAYKQIRCINMAKRGMLALNLEWLGMGQLHSDGFAHYRMNQLDLCGTSGLAPFYLAMERGLDVLLAHKNADPQRVAVAGLSGGGWQTIFISSLDTRVTLTNPVAGYSSFLTRIHHHSDLGDSEQTPCDMATVADYAHLTAMMAPRATLLTFNIKDDCCFASGHALQPLLNAAESVFKLYDTSAKLRSHVNHDPGTHNFGLDNREALYRMLKANFYEDDDSFDATEIQCDNELKTKEQLQVELPANNADFHSLALALSNDLPRGVSIPEKPDAAWAKAAREQLAEVVRSRQYDLVAKEISTEQRGKMQVTFWQLQIGKEWTVPATEFSHDRSTANVDIVIADAGRGSTAATVARLLGENKRVLAVDPYYVGEAKNKDHDFLFALLVSAVGERPLGIQASQLATIARWQKQERKMDSVAIIADGPRMSLAALVAANLETACVDRLQLHQALGTLKEVIDQNLGVNEKPELFCFGLLEKFDIDILVALAAPREVSFVEPSDRAKTTLSGLKSWYAKLGKDFDPLR